MRIALLSNVTVEILAGMLKKEHSVWVPTGFGAWLATALNPPDDLRTFDPEIIYLLIDGHFAADLATEAERKSAVVTLQAAFPKVPVVVPDIARLANDMGDGFYDERMWKLGAMPWSMKGLRELKKLFGIKKVLALDLDNTLWKGVIGEDGVAGVEPDVALQTDIKCLKDRGVVLTIVSKNNPDDVERIWSDPRMVLKREDFVAITLNWKDKSTNLMDQARELNVGVDSFVFVDDNPAERAQMRAVCPAVAVADFPPQLSVYFPPRELTAEDLQKTAQYQAEVSRKNFAVGLSLEDYLQGLQIWVEVHEMREAEMSRVAQLSQKTNQFNVLTNRYSESDVLAFAADRNRTILTVHAGDRFGEQGLVAFVQLKFGSAQSAEIVDWVMSCRAMNRTIEYAVQEQVEAFCMRQNVMLLKASWKRTAKNAPVADLFDKFGFAVLSDGADSRAYALEMPRQKMLQHQVSIKEKSNG